MFWRRRIDREQDFERELRAHLELEAEEQAENGSVEEAGYAAMRAFGNTAIVTEEVRAVWKWMALDNIAQDFRYALRTMHKNPGFTAVAVVSLALGIGANTAIFTFVNAALLKPLPYPNSDRIVALLQRPSKGGKAGPVHPRSFLVWQEHARSFEALAIAQTIPVNTRTAEGAEQIQGMWASSEVFRVFGVNPTQGRLFADNEGFNRTTVQRGFAGATSVAVISDEFWKRHVGSDTAIIGRTIPIERGNAVIVGVLPAGFRIGSQIVDIYLPLPLDRTNPEAVGSRSFQCYGLLRPGVTLMQAQAEMAVIAGQVAEHQASEREWQPAVLSLREYLVRDNRLVLLVLLGVVVFVLLIACANLAGLLLTRGVGRRHELALRASLGADRGRLMQQLLVESLALAMLGGALGLMVGGFASRALGILASDAIAFGQILEARLDASAFGFTFLLSLFAAIAFGLAPAWQASRFDLQTGLREHGRSASDTRGQQRLRSTLVSAEVALAVTLLIGSGLLVRTFAGLLSVPLGFQPERVLTMRTLVLGDPARRWNLIQSIIERVEALPEVRGVGAIQFLPLSGFANRWRFRLVGRSDADSTEKMQADGSTVSYGYLSAMGIPVLRGRDFTRTDGMNSPRVALVNEAFVRKYLTNEDPIGRQILGDWSDAKPAEIVGVVGDIRHNGLTNEPVPTIFLSQSQSPGYITFLAVRSDADHDRIAAAIRRAVREVDPGQPLTAVQSMEQYVSVALARPRLFAVLVSVFAFLALLLAAIGLYGLIAYTVNRRRQEIGIRIALGAHPNAVIRSLLAHGLRLTLTGLAIGLICAAALRRYLESLLFGVSTGDLITWVAGASVLVAVALIAIFIPARRVLKVDPIQALRCE